MLSGHEVTKDGADFKLHNWFGFFSKVDSLVQQEHPQICVNVAAISTYTYVLQCLLLVVVEWSMSCVVVVGVSEQVELYVPLDT